MIKNPRSIYLGMIASDLIRSDKARSGQHNSYFVGLLFISKILRAIGVYVITDLLKYFHAVQLLLFLKTLTAFLVVPIQKPFSVGQKLSKKKLTKIVQYATLSCIVQVVWFYGITMVGPLRAVLIFENSPVVVLAVLQAVFCGIGGPAKLRGALLFILGMISLILLDRDSESGNGNAESHSTQTGMSHVFFHAIHWFGMSDHKGGVMILLFATLMNTFVESFGRKLAVEVGGGKRLYAASSAISCGLLLPWFCFIYFFGGPAAEPVQQHSYSWLWCVLMLAFACLSVFVVDFYVETICNNRLEIQRVARWCPVATFIAAVCIIPFWYSDSYQYNLNAHPLDMFNPPNIDTGGPHHGFSGGLWFTIAFLSCATIVLTGTSSPRARTGQFIGFSAQGAPLYIYGEDFLQRTSQSVVLFVKSTLKSILANSDSRRIFYFLCANLAFTFVEFAYGIWTNSLGLISDAFHMVFDCSALVMGLVAAVMSSWKPTRIFSFGYGRVEILSGFVNALFLLVIAFFIFLEAIERVFDPPDVITEKLITVSFGGLIVNLFGMFAFSHAHTHGGGGGSHSHSGGSHEHSHGSHGHSHSNANMQGVFLHVLADTLGSVAVILSSFLIQRYGWLIADPICSLLLSALIFVSALPLLKQSALVLLERVPSDKEHLYQETLEKLLHLDGVISYSDAHLWQQKDECYMASVHVQVTQEANHQRLASQIRNMFTLLGVTTSTVQVEKNSFYVHLTALRPTFESAKRISKKPLSESLLVKAI